MTSIIKFIYFICNSVLNKKYKYIKNAVPNKSTWNQTVFPKTALQATSLKCDL